MMRAALVAVLALATSADGANDVMIRNQIRARAYAYIARIAPGVVRRVFIEIVPLEDMPMEGLIATTAREPEGCFLRFTPRALALPNDEAVKHEAAHCALDYDVLSDTGYRHGTPRREIAWREARAASIGRGLR